MNDDTPITKKVSDAVTKAADTVKHAVEDFADAAAKAPQPAYMSDDGVTVDVAAMPVFARPRPKKRTRPGKTAKKPAKKTVAKKKTAKKKSKKKRL
jgi:hypothetical protein